MWICFNDSFVSIVQDRERIESLVVRARTPTHLERLFPGQEIVMSPGRDYACRYFTSPNQLVKLLADRVDTIDYTNFKGSVADHRLRRLYGEFWYLHAEYQRRVTT